MARFVFVLMALLAAGCCGDGRGVLGRSALDPSAEALAGTQAAPAVEHRHGGVVRDAVAERRMERIGRRLAAGSPVVAGPCTYRLLASLSVNALSLPGARIYVTRGLYARLGDDEVLAAVLAHEWGHVCARDHFGAPVRDAAQSLRREIAADTNAALLLHRAGFRPSAMAAAVWIVRDAQPRGWADARIAALRCSAPSR